MSSRVNTQVLYVPLPSTDLSDSSYLLGFFSSITALAQLNVTRANNKLSVSPSGFSPQTNPRFQKLRAFAHLNNFLSTCKVPCLTYARFTDFLYALSVGWFLSQVGYLSQPPLLNDMTIEADTNRPAFGSYLFPPISYRQALSSLKSLYIDYIPNMVQHVWLQVNMFERLTTNRSTTKRWLDVYIFCRKSMNGVTKVAICQQRRSLLHVAREHPFLREST